MTPQDGEKIPLSRPDLREREETLLLEAFRSGRLALGPMQKRFEQQFARWLGVEDAVAVSSGTAALHLGVCGLEPGKRLEVPYHLRGVMPVKVTVPAARAYQYYSPEKQGQSLPAHFVVTR